MSTRHSDLPPADPISTPRRTFVLAAALAAGAVTRSAIGQESDAANAESGLPSLALECVDRGEACISHCLMLLEKGDKGMAACARSVMAMLPVCQAMSRLAHLESTHVATLAPACRTICDACETECRKHEKLHAVCAQCADACSRLSKALSTLA